MTILAVGNLKGGVGKTTICHNLAGVCAERGLKTLVVDMDHQANLTELCRMAGHQPEEHSALHRALAKGEAVEGLIKETPEENIWLLGSEFDLAFLERDLAEEVNPAPRLAEILSSLKERFDRVIIDCPPNPGLATRMALVAADAYLIPLDAVKFSLYGSDTLQKMVANVRHRVNPQLKFVGYVVNRVKLRANITKAYAEMYEERLGRELLKTRIKDSVRFQEAISAGQPITTYAPDSDLAETFRELAREIDL